MLRKAKLLPEVKSNQGPLVHDRYSLCLALPPSCPVLNAASRLPITFFLAQLVLKSAGIVRSMLLFSDHKTPYAGSTKQSNQTPDTYHL